MDIVYLDHAATTPVDREVIEAMVPCLQEVFGNPSSNHALGYEARQAMEEARLKIARFMSASLDEVFFTSGGTESNNWAIKGTASANRVRGNHIITTSIEHHSVLDPCRYLEEEGFQVTYLPVDKNGLVDPDDVQNAISEKTILISVMHANNEIGTIEPVAEIGRIARKRGITFHTDAVQTFGHIPVDVEELGVDLLSVSGHKLYGPKGIGVLYIRKQTGISSFMHGGDQEGYFRAGTENVPGIVGLGKAVEVVEREEEKAKKELLALRERLIGSLLNAIDGVHLNGHPRRRLPNNVNVSIDGISGEAMLLELRLEGICASNGSACHASSIEPSHVLLSIGLTPESAKNALRFTLGRRTTEGEVDYLLTVLPPIVERLRKDYISDL